MPLCCPLLSVGALTEVSEEHRWCCVWWRWRRHGESQQVSHGFDVLLSKWLHGGSFRFQKIFQCALLEVRFCRLNSLYFSERHPILAGVSWGHKSWDGKADRPEISCSWKAVMSAEMSGSLQRAWKPSLATLLPSYWRRLVEWQEWAVASWSHSVREGKDLSLRW